MIFHPDHNVFALFNAKMAIVTHGNPSMNVVVCHCRPMGHYLVFVVALAMRIKPKTLHVSHHYLEIASLQYVNELQQSHGRDRCAR